MSAARTAILDNEAVQALIDPAHSKHRRALAVVEAVAARNQRRSGSVHLVVPTSVRVEAGWDRRARRAAVINRLRVVDASLDTSAADRASAVRSELSVSVVDAHVAVVLANTPGPHAVITSDAHDLQRIAHHLDVRPTVVRL